MPWRRPVTKFSKIYGGFSEVDGFKQRIVGAIVLISLAVIFIPMLFDEPHEERTSRVLPIPEQPPLSTFTIEEPKPLNLPEPGAQEPGLVEAPDDAPASYSAAPGEVSSPAGSVAPSVSSPMKSAPAKEPEAVGAPDANAVVRESVLDEKGLANAWSVQIGTFANHDNAYRLRDRIRESGLKGYTREITSDGQSMVRVFAGPVLTDVDAQKLKTRVDEVLGVKSLVVRYTP